MSIQRFGHQFRYQPTPRRALRVLRLFLAGLLDMATAAECLKVREVPRVAALRDWHHVIAFEPAGPPAPTAPPAVAVEHHAPRPCPSPAVEPFNVAHATSAVRNARRAGRAIARW